MKKNRMNNIGQKLLILTVAVSSLKSLEAADKTPSSSAVLDSQSDYLNDMKNFGPSWKNRTVNPAEGDPYASPSETEIINASLSGAKASDKIIFNENVIPDLKTRAAYFDVYKAMQEYPKGAGATHVYMAPQDIQDNRYDRYFDRSKLKEPTFEISSTKHDLKVDLVNGPQFHAYGAINMAAKIEEKGDEHHLYLYPYRNVQIGDTNADAARVRDFKGQKVEFLNNKDADGNLIPLDYTISSNEIERVKKALTANGPDGLRFFKSNGTYPRFEGSSINFGEEVEAAPGVAVPAGRPVVIIREGKSIIRQNLAQITDAEMREWVNDPKTTIWVSPKNIREYAERDAKARSGKPAKAADNKVEEDDPLKKWRGSANFILRQLDVLEKNGLTHNICDS